jgi:iron complex outermembrane receptor protein
MFSKAAASAADGFVLPVVRHGRSAVHVLAWLVALAVSGTGVHAQTPQPSGAEAAPTSEGLQEVIVTAQKRTENLQTTPITANVLSGKDLQDKDITNLESLQFFNPGMSVTEAGITANVNIRGIGLGVSSPVVVAGVAVYRDGLFQFPILSSEPLYDMNHVEVLRGPQGTFVGSSSTGGAIFYVAQAPVLGSSEDRVQLQFGNYEDVGTQGAFNVPLGDTFAARLAFNTESRDSFFTQYGTPSEDNPSHQAFAKPGDLDQRNLRLGLLWEPSEGLSIKSTTTINRNTTGGLAHVVSQNSPHYVPVPLSYSLDYSIPDTVYDEWGVREALEISYRFANGMTFRSLSGTSQAHVDYVDDYYSTTVVSGEFNNNVHEHILSQEFNLLSPTDQRLQWVAGGYYFYDPAQVVVQIDEPVAPTTVQSNTITYKTATAGFGQLSMDLIDGLQIEAGARYTASRAHETGETVLLGLAPFAIDSPQYTWEHDSGTTGKVALNWTVTQDEFAYIYAAKGYKAGGVNGGGAPTFAPETVYDYEIGLKSTLLEGHVRTQVDGFYMDYRDLQLSSYIIPSGQGGNVGAGGANGVTNAGKATIDGFEAQAQSRFEGLGIDANLAYVHSVLGTTLYVNPNLLPGDGNVPLGPQCPASPTCFDYSTATSNLAGRPNPYSPELTISGGIEYAIPMFGGSLTPRVDYSYTAHQWQTIQELPGDYMAVRHLMNAKLTYTHDKWMVQLYGTNLFDQIYIAGSTYGPSNFLGNPRQFGVRIAKNF